MEKQFFIGRLKVTIGLTGTGAVTTSSGVFLIFIGGVSKMGRIYVGKRTVDNFESKMREFEKLPITTETATHFWSSVNSYLGFMIHYSSYAIRRRILEKWMAKWYSHFYICSHHSKISLKKRFRIRNEFIHGLVLPDITI